MNLTLNLALFQSLNVAPPGALDCVATTLRTALDARTEPPRALIVHANAADREILRRLLEQQHVHVHEARCRSEALDLANSVRPDIVLLVVLAPRQGVDTVRAFRAAFDMQSLPLIVLTDAVDPIVLEDCLAAGATDFVCRPVEWAELSLRIRLHLARAKRHEAPARPQAIETWA